MTKLQDIPVLYINLDRRIDRRKHFENQFSDFKNVERVEAIDTCDTNGYYGCAQSHIKALKRAKEKGYSQVIICEDDFEWIDKDKFEYPTMDFDVCMISGKINVKEEINDKYNKVLDGRHLECNLVKSHFYDTMIDNFEEGYRKLCYNLTHAFFVDVYWVKLQNDNMFITPSITIGRQMENYSDIQKKNMKRY